MFFVLSPCSGNVSFSSGRGSPVPEFPLDLRLALRGIFQERIPHDWRRITILVLVFRLNTQVFHTEFITAVVLVVLKLQ